MTKKDYELIAGVISREVSIARHFESRDASKSCVNIAEGLARAMADDNPRFNRARFLAACGVR